MFWLELLVVLAALALGARIGGIFLGIAGGLGLAFLVFVFGLAPSSPPIDVMLIITAVIVAASVLQVVGGMDYLISVAERILRANPKKITFLAPLVCYCFTFMAGTGNIAFALLPVIAEVARDTGVRPERPMSISVVASQQAITASPVSAAMAALVAMLAPLGVGMGQIMLVCVPATLAGCLLGALTVWKYGVELDQDPEYKRRLAEGLIQASRTTDHRTTFVPQKGAKASVALFILGALIIVLLGTIPELRPSFTVNGKTETLSMTHAIEIIMLVVAGVVTIICKPKVDNIAKSSVFQAGMTGVICIFGLAWMGDTLISAYLPDIKVLTQDFVQNYP
jgi:anaerobic C4-dicarboxylate transporter-like protein